MSLKEIFEKVGVSDIKEFIERELKIMDEGKKKGLEINFFQGLTNEEINFILPYIHEAFEKGIVKK